MNRRNFLSAMVGGVAAGAAVRTFPFRVFSFPTEIKVPTVEDFEWFVHPDQMLMVNKILKNLPEYLSGTYPALEYSYDVSYLDADGRIVKPSPVRMWEAADVRS